MRKSNDYSLKEAITALMQMYNLKGKMDEVHLRTSWDKIMGIPIARHTKGMKLKDGVLFLSLDSPSLKQELLMSKSKMIKLLNEEFGEEIIKEVVFR